MITIGKYQIDPTPRALGANVIDLLGMSAPEDFNGGGTFACWIPEEHRPATIKGYAEAETIAKSIRTKVAAANLLTALGVRAWPEEKLSSLRCSIQIALFRIWFPYHFVNPGPARPALRLG